MKNADIQTELTKRIVAAIQSGKQMPWRRPWSTDPNAGAATNLVSRKGYRGINPIILQCASLDHNFTSKWWATYKQWGELGLHVKARPAEVTEGRWGTQIVYWHFTKKEVVVEGETKTKTVPFLRFYTVFNADQVEGAEAFRVTGHNNVVVEPDYERAEKVIAESGATLHWGGNQAFFNPAADDVTLPYKSQFPQLPEFYRVAFHELTHWSERRVGWLRKDFKEGDAYAMGELIAELGSCFIADATKIPQSQDTAESEKYLSHWLERMKSDPKYIFQASSIATKACDFLVDHKLPQQQDNEVQAAA